MQMNSCLILRNSASCSRQVPVRFDSSGKVNRDFGRATGIFLMTIAIDGPAGAGKSTVSRRVAAALGFTYIDTGAMYRALAWHARQTETDTADADALSELAQHYRLTFSPLDTEMKQSVFVNGEDVTQAIRTPEVSQLTSRISAFPQVRHALVAQQQRMSEEAEKGVVLEGRDIGTVVFPNAEVKIFLTASPEERARRRCEQLKALGMEADFARVLSDQMERDARDSQRVASPLVAAPDAHHINTDDLTVEQVIARILELAHAAQTTTP
jgi:cytidylate kinase